MIRRPPRSTRTDPLLPYTTLFRSGLFGLIPLGGHTLNVITVLCGRSSPLEPDQALEAIGEPRSEEHTSELQSLMRISYAVFCLKKKMKKTYTTITIAV